MGGVDEAVGGVEVAAVGGAHDLGCLVVAVAVAEGEEGAEGLRVQGCVAPVAGVGAVGWREDARVVVVADGLGGQAVFAGEVDGAQGAPPFEA
ncbi:hypothetical protein GCM10010483_48230 [Actinokineospora diospyrosa]